MGDAMICEGRNGSAPRTPSAWLFGESGGVQVWGVEGDTRVWASVLIASARVVLLNHLIAGTAREHGALDWALSHVARGVPGYYVLLAD
jgi:hypothetical protein